MGISEIIGIVQIIVAVIAIGLAFKAYQKVLEQIKIASEQNKQMIKQREYDLRLIFLNTTKFILVEIDELEAVARNGCAFLEENGNKLSSFDAKYISDLEKQMKKIKEDVVKQRFSIVEMSSDSLEDNNLLIIEDYTPKLIESLTKVHTMRSHIAREIQDIKEKIQ